MNRKKAAGVFAAAAVGVAAFLWSIRQSGWAAWDIWRADRAAPSALANRQGRRLAALISFARTHSAFYRALYRNLPADISDFSALPVVAKPDLMAHFDQWVTDAKVTRAGVETFVADLSLVGKRYLGRYAVWTTSGTTGRPGIFIHDYRAVSTYAALVTMRGYRWVTPALLWHLLWHGRFAVLVAAGGHFAIADWFERMRRRTTLIPGLRGRIRVFSVTAPLSKLVRELNNFRPSLLTGYPSVMKLLAIEQHAGRLRIAPMYIGTGGEWLEHQARAQIVETFQCLLRDNYGASEFPYAAFECAHGWLHVNADWLILEPVDSAYWPVPVGTPSQTVLLTNLANHVQPLIRYDLGDSITVRADPCPCGSPLPAIHVEGRSGDILHLRAPSGNTIAVLPLAIGTVLEETPGVLRTQVIQTGDSTLTLRLESARGAGPAAPEDIWQHVEQRLREYLASLDILSVTIARAPEPPQQNPVSGKFRQVWSEVQSAEMSHEPH